MFTLPDELPGTVAELDALLTEANEEFDALAKILEDPDAKISEEQLVRMRELKAAQDKLEAAVEAINAEDNARLEEARQLAESRRRPAEDEEEDPPSEDDDAEEETTEEEAPPEETAEETTEEEPEKEPALAAAKGKSFKGLGKARGKTPARSAPKPEVGFRMSPGASKYKPGIVSYQELAISLDSMAPGTNIRRNREGLAQYPNKVPMSLATLERGFPEELIVDDVNDLVTAVEEATKPSNYRPAKFDKDGAMAASGGWCAPSETIFDFCAVPAVADIVTLPDINMNRGGLRWPEEPDFTELYATLPWRFTEAELQAVDVDGNPTAIKPCVEIPCPGMDEIRPEAIGLCITAGILQRRGWPELIAKFLGETMLAHQHKVSSWTILDMLAGSTPVTFGDAAGFAAAGSALNALDLAATNIRILERLPRTAVVEGIAPVWFPAVLRADLAYNEGRDPKAVTDAEIDGWLGVRNIRLQYTVDWQTRGAGQPGIATTVAWPATVQVMLYPAGAWFRHLDNVIEVGTLYDKAQLQQNRYTELFTEDEYFVTKRCRTSQVVTIPVCANGAIGNRVALTCGTNT